LREKLPVDARFKQLVRYRNWKAVIAADGGFHLYDMLDPRDGIGEQTDVSEENPDIVELIRRKLSAGNITGRYVTIGSESLSPRAEGQRRQGQPGRRHSKDQLAPAAARRSIQRPSRASERQYSSTRGG
jgi:hypothetical protein